MTGTTGDSLTALGGITWGNIPAGHDPRADFSRLPPIPIQLLVVGGAVMCYHIINKTPCKHPLDEQERRRASTVGYGGHIQVYVRVGGFT